MKSKPIQRRLNLLAGFGVVLLLLGVSFKVWDRYDYPLPDFLPYPDPFASPTIPFFDQVGGALHYWCDRHLRHPKFERKILSKLKFPGLQCEYVMFPSERRMSSGSGGLTFHQDGRLTAVDGPLSFEATKVELRFERIRRSKIRIYGDGIEYDLTIEPVNEEYFHLGNESQNFEITLFAPSGTP